MATTLAAFSPSRQFLAVVVGGATLRVWDTKRSVLQSEFRPGDHLAVELSSLAWATPSGAAASAGAAQDSLVALGTSAGDVVVWNVATAEVHLRLRKPGAHVQGPVRHLAVNGALTHLYACSRSSTIAEFSLQTGKALRTLTPLDAAAVAAAGGFGRLALSPDNSRLLAAGTRIVLWDLSSGAQVAAFQGHASPVRALAFLPSGKHFVSADGDMFLNVWAARGVSGPSASTTGGGSSQKKKMKQQQQHGGEQQVLHRKARVKLIASTDVHAVHVQAAAVPGGGAHTVNVCCVGRTGDVDLWRVDVRNKDVAGAPQQAHATIVCDHAAADDDASGSGNSSNDVGGSGGIEEVGGVFAVGCGPVNGTTTSNGSGTPASTASTPHFYSSLLCARGSALQPRFETVPLEADGALVSSTLAFLDTTALLKALRRGGGRVDTGGSVSGAGSGPNNSGVGSSAADQRGAHVIGARDSVAGITGQKRRLSHHVVAGASGSVDGAGGGGGGVGGGAFAATGCAEGSTDGPPSKQRREGSASSILGGGSGGDGNDAAAPDAETLEERLLSLRQFTEKPADDEADERGGGGGGGGLDAVDFAGGTQSLVSILQQALHADDRVKLEYCLAVHDKEIITTTINKLPAACILPFLQQLVDRLEKSPRRGRVLIGWIRRILLRHTAYLMTVPDLAKELAALYEIIASRSALYTKFCRLSGERRSWLVVVRWCCRGRGCGGGGERWWCLGFGLVVVIFGCWGCWVGLRRRRRRRCWWCW